MTSMSPLLRDLGDHEQIGRLLALTLESARIGNDQVYKALVERLHTDPDFEEAFNANLQGHGLIMLGRSMEHGVALAQGEDLKSIFCADRADFTDGRVKGGKQKRLSYVRLASVVAVCAAAFPKSAEGGERDMVSFTVDDVVALMRKAASDAVIPDDDEPLSLPEPEEIIAAVIQDTPTDDRNEGAVQSVRANVQKTIAKLCEMNYLIARPANSEGVVDYAPHWKLTKLVEHFADRTLVARLRAAA